LSLIVLLTVLVAVGEPARAAPDPAAGSGPVLLVPTPGVGEKTAKSSPKLVAAMQRDLHLTRGEAIARIGREHAAGAVESRARRAAGQHYAGSWLASGGSSLMVAVTDQRVAPAVRAAGATPKLVTHPRGVLEDAQLKLRARADRLPGTAVHGWHVDANRNRLLVSVAPGQQPTAAKWIAAAGVPAGLVAYETSQHPQVRTADVIPGDAIETPKGGCTAGIAARNPFTGAEGVVTAGHCASTADPIRIGGSPAGITTRSSYPTIRGPDQAFVELNQNFRPLPLVRADVGAFPVLGTQAASVGATICRYGRTTKASCGELTGTNEDVPTRSAEDPNAPLVTTVGVNRMIPCIRPGDSGGPVITPAGQAQGTQVSSQPCGLSPLGPSYYQPINGTLVDFRIEPLIFETPPFIPPPNITAFTCESDGDVESALFSCELNWDGGKDPDQVQVSSNGRWIRRINEYDNNFALLAGNCAPVSATFITVSVIDAAGRRSETTQSGFCPRG
jgi:streptogrisin C